MMALVSLSLGACHRGSDVPTEPPATKAELQAASDLDRGELSDGVAIPYFDEDGYYEMAEVLLMPPMPGDADDRPPRYVEVELAIEPTLAAACGLSRPTVTFATDSAELREPKKDSLEHLAHCLNSNPLEEELLSITGHTDPRGTEEYNRELGLDRADAVAKVLREHGVNSRRIDTYSLGEAKAPTEPEQWALARRVVIRIDR